MTAKPQANSSALVLPILMDHLERKPICIFASSSANPLERVPARDRSRKDWARMLIPKMHRAQKFMFDSGSDTPATAQPVRETAVNMIESKLFHLAFAETWIEDPFANDPTRPYMYLCLEQDDIVEVYHFTDNGPTKEDCRFVMGQIAYVIDLAEAQDGFIFPGVLRRNQTAVISAGEAIYAIKKFVVTLATEQAVHETVPGEPFRSRLSKQPRQYPHSVVRVPLAARSTAFGPARNGAGGRRRHLVRGYMWGKNTRPQSEWRWHKPFWRGRAELGTVDRDHYVVGQDEP